MDASASIAIGHMKFYGHVSFSMSLAFVTETVAYDVCALVELAHELQMAQEEQLLRAFLDLDRSADERGQEQALKGVRKAQVKLATYYLHIGDTGRARRIWTEIDLPFELARTRTLPLGVLLVVHPSAPFFLFLRSALRLSVVHASRRRGERLPPR